MVSPWKISQIKGDTGYGFCFCIGCHVLMGIQEQLIILRTVILFSGVLLCVPMPVFECQMPEHVHFSPASLLNNTVSFTISHRCINTNVSRHDLLPDKMLRVCGDLKIFHTKILSRFFTVHDNTGRYPHNVRPSYGSFGITPSCVNPKSLIKMSCMDITCHNRIKL